MNFIETLTLWQKGELLQGKIMIAIGVLLLVAVIAIFRSQNVLLRGTMIPLTLLLTVLIGYGGYILQSRPAHVAQSVALYEQSPNEAVQQEIQKHTSDNKAGKTLLKIYPILAIVALLALMFLPSLYLKGLAIGFALMFLATYVIDNGFVTRSDAVLATIKSTK